MPLPKRAISDSPAPWRWKSAGAGITGNAICPGYIHTEMLDAVPPDVMQKSILPLIPVGRLGEPRGVFSRSRYGGLHQRLDGIDQRRPIHELSEEIMAAGTDDTSSKRRPCASSGLSRGHGSPIAGSTASPVDLNIILLGLTS